MKRIRTYLAEAVVVLFLVPSMWLVSKFSKEVLNHVFYNINQEQIEILKQKRKRGIS